MGEVMTRVTSIRKYWVKKSCINGRDGNRLVAKSVFRVSTTQYPIEFNKEKGT